MPQAGTSIRRLLKTEVRRQLRGATRSLRRDEDDAVHQARRAIKKARAIGALLRQSGARGLGKDLKRLRSAHHALSPLRDAEVAVATLDGLTADAGLSPGESAEAGAYLARRHAALQKRFERGVRGRVVRALGRVRRTVVRWRVPRLEPGDVARAIRGSSAAAIDAMAAAEASGKAEDLHRWRRRLKRLSHQLEAVAPIAEGPVPLAESLADVQVLLGAHHDLVTLLGMLAEPGVRGRQVRAVVSAARGQLPPLGRRAIEGGHVLSMSPEEVERQLACALSPRGL